MLLNVGILATVIVAGAFLFHPAVAGNRGWRATITPLASIIGSGFLVLGPLLQISYGLYAPLIMAFLCAVAYGFGAAIRFNIAEVGETHAYRGNVVEVLETAASWVLAFAYIISVAYYLNLFGAFGVSLTGAGADTDAKLLTTAAFAFVLVTGWTRGFRALEKLEQVSVNFKLAIIAGLILALAVYFGRHAAAGELTFNAPQLTGWQGIALAFGLLVTVQGFETSRYLGATYDAPTRINSMRRAQFITTVIYMVYIGLMAYVFSVGELKLSETAIIGMMDVVAPILPLILVAAALSAQLSAAIADTGGAGGLFEELSGGRITQRLAYALLAVIGVALTWFSNVFEIISHASRAFALYYALQAAIAAVSAWRNGGLGIRAVSFGLLALLGLAIVVFGMPAEA
ncbi:MAG: hypothetical protein KDJ55_06000 [Rhodobiaceae bacterium]|nr:hypothetical protein [Rhodobiaceae bacterium]MCC0011829.1 hypothetical protein [Rhodobiaceae bacterium]MCC0050514.1 hypothetical protein [Rhodobiaceae bacterium]MCC0061253.1 hypothetical protein [Rhodobiaceae bacterium]